jgi:hypothetical protein
MKKKVGRPKKARNEAKAILVAVKVAPPEARKINHAAKKAGMSKPDWIRRALLSVAEEAA